MTGLTRLQHQECRDVPSGGDQITGLDRASGRQLPSRRIVGVHPRGSFRGASHFYGKQGVHFFTQTKTITSNWKASSDEAGRARASTSMPILGK